MSGPKRKISDEEKLAIFNELKFGDTIYLWYDSAFKRGEKYKPFKMGKRTKSEKYNLSKFSMASSTNFEELFFLEIAASTFLIL